MTDRQLDSSFDREIRELFEAGQRAAPPATLERGLARAAIVAQRRSRFARLDRHAWPPQRGSASDASVQRLARLALAAVLVVVVGAVIAVGARLVRLPPAPTPVPTLRPTSSLALTIEPAGTIDLRIRDRYPLRLWPDGRILIGHEYLFDLDTGTSEMLAVVLEPGPNPSVYPIADGRVVLIYDKDIEGVMAQGEHRVAVLDPASGAITDVGRLPPYAFEQRLVLRDGRIFGSGGFRVAEFGSGNVFDTTYVFDINTGTTTQLGTLRQPRSSHVMIELLDGRVLVVGGERVDTDQFPGPMTQVEVYDVETGTSTPVPDTSEGWGGQIYPYTLLGDGRVVLAGGQDMTEPCPFFPEPSGGIIGAGSGRQIVRLETLLFDPATGTMGLGPLVPSPEYTYVPLAGDRALISRQERAFVGCAVEERPVPYAWLGIVEFGSGTILGSPNLVTGEGALEVEPEAIYATGLLLPDGRVALLEADGLVPGPRRIDILSINP